MRNQPEREKKTTMPKISALMCTYNEIPDYLEKAVKSVLNQTFKDFEFIIVDDSTERTVIEYLELSSKKDNRIVYVHNQKRKGFVASLNHGLEISKGEYIARIDSDDIQLIERFKEQIKYLELHKEIGILGCWCNKITDSGEVTGIRKYPPRREIPRQMMIQNVISYAGVMIRRSVFDRIGKYGESIPRPEDYELWMRAIAKGIVLDNFPKPLFHYRIPDYRKRVIENWTGNLKIKIKYFGLTYLPQRLFGIILVVLIIIVPKTLISRLYTFYNRLS
jgi:glycosyltransferase involved in cell wall biosynthesis